MIINLIWIILAFSFILSAIGFFLKLSGTVEDETVFYMVSGIFLALLSVLIFSTGVQYDTGRNTTVTVFGSTTVYNYSSMTNPSLSIIALSVMTMAIFLILTTSRIRKNREKNKTDIEGKSSW